MTGGFDAAAAVGSLAVRLDLRKAPDAVATHARRLLEEPLDLFARHPHWPSAMNDCGMPLELSLKLDGPHGTSLRWTTDGTDHRTDVVGNWSRYVELAAAVAGCRSDAQCRTVEELCRTHLDGIPPGFPSRLVVGGGYAAPDRTRGTLYFRTGWMAPPVAAARLRGPLDAAARVRQQHGGWEPEVVEVVGYDFTDGALDRWKIYTWLPVQVDSPFSAVGGRHPDLVVAGGLYEALGERVPAAARERALFLQTGGGPGGTTQRLFFFAAAWGFGDPRSLAELLEALADLGVDVRPLLAFRAALGDVGLRLRLTMVAVGGRGDVPSVTFYFLPGPDQDGRRPDGAGADPLSRASACLAAGVRALVDARSADGSWDEGGPEGVAPATGLGLPPDFVTSYVAAVLTRQRAAADLAPTGDWLTRSLPGHANPLVIGWSSTVLAGLARSAPEAWPAVLGEVLEDGAAGTDATATAVEALARGPADRRDERALLGHGVRRLVQSQRADGGWAADVWADDRSTTAAAVAALGAATGVLDPGLRAPIEESRVRASAYLARSAVPAEPAAVGRWLFAWLVAGGSPRHPSVGRALAALERSQRTGGSWRGSPCVRLPRGTATTGIDDGIITTATVVDALHELVLALSAPASRNPCPAPFRSLL